MQSDMPILAQPSNFRRVAGNLCRRLSNAAPNPRSHQKPIGSPGEKQETLRQNQKRQKCCLVREHDRRQSCG